MIFEESSDSPGPQFSHVKYSFLVHPHEVFSINFDTFNDRVQIKSAKISFI